MTTGNGLAVAAAFVGGSYLMMINPEAGSLVVIAGVLGWIASNVFDK